MTANLHSPLLEVNGLTVSYGQGRRTHRALSDVSFTVDPGETVAVVGESGSGKSTLAHTVLGLLPASGVHESGSVLLAGADLTGMRRRQLDSIRGRTLALIPQDPTVSLNPVHRIGKQVAEILRIHNQVPRSETASRVVELLEEVGLAPGGEIASRYPHELSGGMRQRVLIAIALACRPSLVVADEPTSALDATVQKKVLDLIDTLTERHNTAVLMITHDLGVAVERAQRILVFDNGRLVEEGSSTSILHAPQALYTKSLMAAAPSLSVSKRLRPTHSLESEHSAEPTPVHVNVESVSKTYRSRQSSIAAPAADSVSFSIGRGTTHALIGESGSGKTTVARMVCGLERPDAGEIHVSGLDHHENSARSRRAWRRAVQLVYQNPYASLDPRASIENIVQEPLDSFGIGPRGQRRRRVRELLDEVALPTRLLSSKPRELSGGQRQRVAIARALAVRPEVLVLDEPVSALDVSVQDRILRLLVDLQAEHRLTYLLITHDIAVVKLVADTITVMSDGRAVESGATTSVLGQPSDPQTIALIDAVPRVPQAI